METLRLALILVPDVLTALARSYEIRRFVLSAMLGIALPYAAQRLDRALISPARRARAWNTASWGAALYAFGPFSMIGWLWVTRGEARRWWRESSPLCVVKSAAVLLAGVVATLVVVVLVALALSLHALVSGEHDDLLSSAQEPAACAPPRAASGS